MKKYFSILIILTIIKLVIHLYGNHNYGFHRDELLHLSASEHFAWGYFEFPPFIALVGKVAHFVFGYSLSGVRFFSTLAGVLILVLCCLVAIELGGKKKAVLLAGTAVLSFIPYYRNHMLFQPVAFDQLFWIVGFYFLLKYFNSKNEKFLIYLGISCGLGLMNKYTFLIWIMGIVIGLFFYQKGILFKNRMLYVGGLITLIIFLPNVFWQYDHGFPALLHLQKLKESQLNQKGIFDFVLGQLKHPLVLSISLIGLYAYFFDSKLKEYKVMGIAAVVTFIVMWFMQSKEYYFFAMYPILFAAGAVKVERLLQCSPKWNYAVAAALFIPIIPFIPHAIPVLPISTYVSYLNLKPEDDGRVILTDDFADMFGWEEQVQLVHNLYKSLPSSERKKYMIWAENYGEAGAIQIIGKKYKLPNPVCAHGSFWSCGTGNTKGEFCISIGNEKRVIEKFFKTCKLVKMIKHKYAIDEENNIPVYLCSDPKIDFIQNWSLLESHVFD
ncbi:MAG: glycosyltransferase family 39 protein [Flavobacteriaceae bacterium]|nr:glycosyltransferase family 39 protein [Flavobacteriaceae bacterium]